MSGVRKIVVVMMAGICLMAVGCGKKEKKSVAVKNPEISLACIGVLPVSIQVNQGTDQAKEKIAALKDGVIVMDNLLQKQFMARDKFRFISSSQLNGLAKDDMKNEVKKARLAADYLSCNGILDVKLHRFRQRVGGKYTASVPASVAFTYTLLDVNSGTVLCRGRFDETQQSLMSNLYTFGSAKRRGFTWITAEELAREGLQEKFGECPYLRTTE